MTDGIPESYDYTWHGKRCCVLTKAPFRRGVKRNALIELITGERMVVPWRAMRRHRA